MASQEYEYSNRTAYGLENDAIQYTWAGFFLFVLISSVVGDTAILIASIKHKAFKLHKVIVVIIQHIAVSDLMVTIVDILPNFITVIAGKQVLGSFLCHFCPFARILLTEANVLLICTMTTIKLLTLKYPIRCGTISKRKAHKFCAACWSVAVIVPLILLVVDWNDIYFSYRIYQCSYGYSSKIYKLLKPLLAALFVFIPIILVIVTTILLLMRAKQVARRGKKTLKWQGFITIVLTAIVYCVSVIPLFVYSAVGSIVKADSAGGSFFHIEFYRIANSFVSLNTISNFYIYSLTVSSFRDFVWSRVRPSKRPLASADRGNPTNLGEIAIEIQLNQFTNS
jgi:hypothetical protein